MATTHLAVKGFWLVAFICALAGAIMMVKGNQAGAVFLALAAFWMIVAISHAKNPGA